MTAELDTAAERVRHELIEIAVDQISKPIAHEFDIRIVLDQSPDGAQCVLVEASSRSVQPVLTRVRVDVRPSGDGLVVERAGTDHRLEVDVAAADPVISEHVHHQLSDFVATCIASALAQLNAEMQRRLGRP
ncbi:MAG: hypothetical protein ACRDOT_02310 [Aeromicrobium sp.]